MMRGCFLSISAFLILVSGSTIAAQDDIRAYFTAEVGTPLIGEPIDLLLTIGVPDGSMVSLPQFSIDWPPFTIKEVGQVDEAHNAGKIIYQQRLIVTLWRPGDYQTPETIIEYQLPGSTQMQRIAVQPAYFAVKTVLNSDDLTLRPLKPPISMFYFSPLAIGAVLLGTGIVGIFIWSHRKKINFVMRDTDSGDLHPSARWALNEFKRIDSANFAPPKIYAVVSDALRHYVQGRFGVQAKDMTTQELVSQLHDCRELSDRRQNELTALLEQADLVKFARIQPAPKSAEKMLSIAQKWIVSVEQEYPEAVE